MKRIVVGAIALLLGFALGLVPLASPALASTGARVLSTSIFLGSGLTYTQNFDLLAGSGTADTLPDGWLFAETGTNANSTYTAGNGSSLAGDTYSFGAAGSSERALGTLLSGSLASSIGASYTNGTGTVVTALQIAYTGEQWRAGVTDRGAADRLDFQLSSDATGLADGAATWTDFDSLDLSSPLTTGTAGPLNGNAAANRTVVRYTIDGLDIPPGGGFWIRWRDFDILGADDGLAIDDFSLTPLDTAPPTETSLEIDGGATTTRSTAATLTLAATGATHMRFSNDGVNWDEWRAYATSATWTLADGDGPKTVYALFKDAAGNESLPVSAAITLHAVPPVMSSLQTSPSAATLGEAVTVTAAVTDVGGDVASAECELDGSGVWQAMTASDGAFDSADEAVTFSLSGLAAGAHEVRVRATDDAGNTCGESDPASFSVTTPLNEGVTLYLHNRPSPPSGNTVSRANLPMDTSQPTATRLYNYDTERDRQAGLLLRRGGTATSPAGSRCQNWVFSVPRAGLDLHGDMTLTFFSAMKYFNPHRRGYVVAYLKVGSRIIATASLHPAGPWQAGSRTWVEKTITFNGLDRRLSPGQVLEVRLIVQARSEDDMYFAYDTIAYPARLVIPASS